MRTTMKVLALAAAAVIAAIAVASDVLPAQRVGRPARLAAERLARYRLERRVLARRMALPRAKRRTVAAPRAGVRAQRLAVRNRFRSGLIGRPEARRELRALSGSSRARVARRRTSPS